MESVRRDQNFDRKTKNRNLSILKNKKSEGTGRLGRLNRDRLDRISLYELIKSLFGPFITFLTFILIKIINTNSIYQNNTIKGQWNQFITSYDSRNGHWRQIQLLVPGTP